MNDDYLADDDELTEEDLSFLSQWESAGHDASEHEQLQNVGENMPEGEADPDAEIEIPGDVSEDGEGEPIGSGESDEIDESKMDISQAEDGTEQMDDPGSGGEGDEEPSDDELGDYSDADDDELDTEDEGEGEEIEVKDWDQFRHDHLEGGDAPDEIPEGEDELEYDDLEDSDSDSSDSDDNNDSDDSEFDSDFEDEEGESESKKVEDEFEGDKRGNTDSEIEDLDEYEKERDEAKDRLDEEENGDEPDYEDDHEQELNADAEDDFEGDAQQELEDHLQNEKKSDEPEPLTEDPDENQIENEEQHSGEFDELPEAGDRCTNHCEDNLPNEDEDNESCPHCTERIRKERELHGAIGTDMHDNDIFPGDKLHVRIPIAMIAKDSIITVNVPNMEVEPHRLAENMSNKIDKERCWLSGRGVSGFTGWHMTEIGNSIWTFMKGTKITFAEKIAQPEFDDLDPEQMMDQLQQELDNYGKDGDEDKSETEEEEIEESDKSPEEDEVEDSRDNETDGNSDDPDNDGSGKSDGEADEPEDLEEHRERREKNELSATQKKRFENLTERNWKKILGTFGGTVEAERLLDVAESVSLQGDKIIVRGGTVVSRGVTYTFGFAARRSAGDEIEEIEQWHKDRGDDTEDEIA